MMRDFVVIVKEVKYDTGKQAFMTKVENINVLVGPKQSLDALKTEIEGFFANFKGSFKSNYRVQAM